MIVATLDFFTPVVDDAYDYGAIAAANALSDLYAMGVDPLFALNISAMPSSLDVEIVQEIMRGGAEKVREAGAVVAGGHSIQDDEPKYGLVAIGMGSESDLIQKRGAKPGDYLVLTKPLGTGVITTALRAGEALQEHVEGAVRWMSELNNRASQVARRAGAKSGTDVTGSGLLGHGVELSEASDVRLRLILDRIPFMIGARRYAQASKFPGGSTDNRLFFQDRVDFQSSVEELSQMMLFDAQTSGGLLLAVSPGQVDLFKRLAGDSEVDTWFIGEVLEGSGIEVFSETEGGGIPESSRHAGVWFYGTE